jgi:hypothetical protein
MATLKPGNRCLTGPHRSLFGIVKSPESDVQGSAADRCRDMVLAGRSLDSWVVLVGLRSDRTITCEVDDCLYVEFCRFFHVK